MNRFRLPISFGLSLVALMTLLPISSPAAPEKSASEKPDKEITVRGQVACLDENGNRLPADHDCNKETSNYELLTPDGRRYRVAATDALATMFIESRVRKMELQITGLLEDRNRIELIKIQALRDKKLYDIFYYCDTCTITAYGPGLCWCCFQPFEFREAPATEKKPQP